MITRFAITRYTQLSKSRPFGAKSHGTGKIILRIALRIWWASLIQWNFYYSKALSYLRYHPKFSIIMLPFVLNLLCLIHACWKLIALDIVGRAAIAPVYNGKHNEVLPTKPFERCNPAFKTSNQSVQMLIRLPSLTYLPT